MKKIAFNVLSFDKEIKNLIYEHFLRNKLIKNMSDHLRYKL